MTIRQTVKAPDDIGERTVLEWHQSVWRNLDARELRQARGNVFILRDGGVGLGLWLKNVAPAFRRYTESRAARLQIDGDFLLDAGKRRMSDHRQRGDVE